MEDQEKGFDLETRGDVYFLALFPFLLLMTQMAFCHGIMQNVGLDMIQFNLEWFIYWCLKMVKLCQHV